MAARKGPSEPTVEMADGVKIEDGIVFVPYEHPRWPGMRGDQGFVPVFGEGYLFAVKDLDADQKAALGLK